MSRAGIWQLKKLVFNYCEFSGSSRGAREFVDRLWPEFVSKNPQLEATSQLWPGRHPNLMAEYANGTTRTVPLRRATAAEILEQATLLRNSTGRKTSLQVKKRQSTANPSIQGAWTPELQEQLRAVSGR